MFTGLSNYKIGVVQNLLKFKFIELSNKFAEKCFLPELKIFAVMKKIFSCIINFLISRASNEVFQRPRVSYT